MSSASSSLAEDQTEINTPQSNEPSNVTLKDSGAAPSEKGAIINPPGGELQPNNSSSRRSSNKSMDSSTGSSRKDEKPISEMSSNENITKDNSGPGPLPPSPVALAASQSKMQSPVSQTTSPSLPSIPHSPNSPKIISIDPSKKLELSRKARAGGISSPMSVGENVVSALKGSLTKLSIYGSSSSALGQSTVGKLSKSSASSESRAAPITPLSPELSAQIKQFSIDGFAKKYFGEHRRGLFRRKVPLEKVIVFQKQLLSSPLMLLTKKLHKDALKCFKVIQKIMGDKSGSGSVSASYSSLSNLAASSTSASGTPVPAKKGTSPIGQLLLSDIASSQSSDFQSGASANASDPSWITKSVISNIQYLIERGLNRGELRDEIYVQLCKQLTRNPNAASVLRGWKLMCVVSISFPPSKNFEDYLKKFAETHFSDPDPAVQVLAKYSHKKLLAVCKKGPRGKVPSSNEIERGLEAAFNPSVFGETLTEVMRIQAKQYPDDDLPHILLVLTKAIRDLNGFGTEGIFRVPGDADAVMDLKCQIENGMYDVSHLNDPNVPASLLKLWMRDLGEPLIPSDLYDKCCKIGMLEPGQDRVNQAMDLVKNLPDINRRVAIYIIKFLHQVGDPVNQPSTKMTQANLAMVFAPNFLRCPSDNPAIILVTTQYEQQFLRTLMENCQLLES